MLAVWMLPAIHYDPLLFFTSVLIGLFASLAAPWIAPKAPADNHAKA
jgi:NO-binding membrane sensor protein with MHYT domain